MTTNYASSRAAFVAQMAGLPLEYKINTVTALPSEELTLRGPDSHRRNDYQLDSSIDFESVDNNAWSVYAPAEPGLYPIRLRSRWGDSMLVNLFVLVPLEDAEDGELNGYRIGRYPDAAGKGTATYNPPRGFMEITRENQDTLLTPHFRLGDFACKQSAAYPRYTVVDPRLLVALETLLQKVNDRGIAARTFRIMSGYRTPHYNIAVLGNRTRYSRHQYGDAVDIFVDEDGDGAMDDLNRDGAVDEGDANVLARIVEDSWELRPAGGMATYPENEHHGPFLHFDVRGAYARWGG